jgi:GR25 family glycosyltransferase involved in LPS biosynthesis
MPHPTSWQAVLEGPSFIINMAECKDRLKASKKLIHDAGFSFITRWNAVDARDAGQLAAAWERHGNPTFDPTDGEFIEYTGKQGCFLSHIELWKYIVDNNIEFATIFEDDIQYHEKWDLLAPKYFEATPKDYELLYMGSQIDYMVKSHILRTPVFCTHAYLITLEGARILLKALLEAPMGVRTIDCMLIDMMKDNVFKQLPCPFKWYVWNGTLFPDAAARLDPSWAKRNSGLVFQDARYGSLVRPW